MKTLSDYLEAHPLFTELPEAYRHELENCAVEQHYAPGEAILLSRQPADHFHFIRSGRVALQIHPPHTAPMLIQTLCEGDVLGWSWMLPPYEWHFDALAQSDVSTFRMDARCVRGKCDQDPRLGYLLNQIFSRIMLERLMATRLQLMDVYGKPTGAGI
jgi:signal-transduction protein with cAMP-binding, CBS, and nucleotidyltransferase domain